MNKLDYNYYEWLISQIRSPRKRTYKDLFSRMHNLEFVWFVPNDDNRMQDALELREEFLYENDGSSQRLSLKWVTFLEVLVALSRRVAFTGGGDAESWAWRLIKNLHLEKMSDPVTETKARRIDDTLYTLIWRTYSASGRGGFFPLKFPTKDQTKLEIWDQMNAYIIEMEQLGLLK